MEITELVDSLEAVQDATLREFYVQVKDGDNKGKFKFAPTEAVTGLKRNRDTILQEKQALEGKYTGIDIDEYRRLKKANDDTAAGKQRQEGDWDAREKSLKDGFAADIKTREDRIGSLTKSLEKHLVASAVTAAVSEAKGRLPLLKKQIVDSVKMIEVNGEFFARVVDESGQVRFKDGREMSIQEYVAELKANPDWAVAFEADKASGSGAAQTTRKPGAAGDDMSKIVNPVERLKAARARA